MKHLTLVLLALTVVSCGASTDCADSSASGASQQHIVFVHFGELQPHQALAVIQARCSHPFANITVIVDVKSGSRAKQWDAVAAAANASVYQPMEYEMVQHFQHRYIHASGNGYAYELFCFYRFLLLRGWMQTMNVTSALALDLDIMLFGDVFQHLKADTALSNFATLATHWTQRSLAAFTQFMLRFYNRNRAVIATDIAKVGLEVDAATAQANTPDWWPVGQQWRHFSDMALFTHFLTTQPGYLLLKRTPDERHEELDALENVKYQLGVNCDGKPAEAYDWRYSHLLGYWQPYLKNSSVLVPGMHFQANCKQHVQGVLCHPQNTCGARQQWCA